MGQLLGDVAVTDTIHPIPPRYNAGPGPVPTEAEAKAALALDLARGDLRKAVALRELPLFRVALEGSGAL